MPFLIFIPLLFLSSEFVLSKYYKILTYGLISAMALYSVITIHDYFRINDKRWEAVNYLMKERHATIHEIDGGFEVNAWYNYDYNKNKSRSSPGKTWWWVDDDKYIIALSHLPGYDVDSVFGFKNWLKNSANKVYVLKRNNDLLKVQSSIDFETLTPDSLGFVGTNQIIKLHDKTSISLGRNSKYALSIKPVYAEKTTFTIQDIKADDFCKISFWSPNPDIKVKVRIKIFSIHIEGGLEKHETVNGWTRYECGFYATSAVSGLSDRVEVKLVPRDSSAIIIDDVRILKTRQ